MSGSSGRRNECRFPIATSSSDGIRLCRREAAEVTAVAAATAAAALDMLEEGGGGPEGSIIKLARTGERGVGAIKIGPILVGVGGGVVVLTPA